MIELLICSIFLVLIVGAYGIRKYGITDNDFSEMFIEKEDQTSIVTDLSLNEGRISINNIRKYESELAELHAKIKNYSDRINDLEEHNRHITNRMESTLSSYQKILSITAETYKDLHISRNQSIYDKIVNTVLALEKNPLEQSSLDIYTKMLTVFQEKQTILRDLPYKKLKEFYEEMDSYIAELEKNEKDDEAKAILLTDWLKKR